MIMFSSLRSRNRRSLSKTISPTETHLSHESQFDQHDASCAPQIRNTNFPQTPPLSPLSSSYLTSHPSSPRTLGDFDLFKELRKSVSPSKRETTEKTSISISTNSRLRLLNPLTLLTRWRSSQTITKGPSGISKTKIGSDVSPVGSDPRIQGVLIHDFSVSRQAKSQIDDLNSQSLDKRTANSKDTAYIEHLKNSWNGDNFTPISMEDPEEKLYPTLELNFSKNINQPSSILSGACHSEEQQEITEQNSYLNYEKATESCWNADSLNAWNRAINADISPISPKTMIPLHDNLYGILKNSDLSMCQFSIEKLADSVDISDLSNKQELSRTVSSEFSFDMKDNTMQERLLEEKYRKKAAEKINELEKCQKLFDGKALNHLSKTPSEELKVDENRDYEDNKISLKSESNLNTDLIAEISGTKVMSMATKINEHVNNFATGTASSFQEELFVDPSTTSVSQIPRSEVYHQPQGFSETQSWLAQPPNYNDFYYDDGMIVTNQNFCSSIDFDESIFDRDDTDQYGRPLKTFSLPQWDAPQVSRSSSPRSISPFCNKSSEFRSSRSYQPDLHSDSHEESLPKATLDYLSEFCESEDRYEFEDYSQDDEIIAVANAEALANDCDGLYGQEFGFYASPETPENQDACEIGGYFGPIGLDRTNKSQSSRHGSHEPSLSPITERSEYSNRNSYMSLNLHSPDFARNRMSPGLGQMAGFMLWDDYEENISLESLKSLN
ncbi:hypothetical protein K3495_g5632 [Podosphaera aphanis]|nr:hypothetical protein K3495_g5632 [Podosphaera aphanis]